MVQAFQCSRCRQLQRDDVEDKVFCACGVTPIPKYRDESDRIGCLEAFEAIRPEQEWHEKFYWE